MEGWNWSIMDWKIIELRKLAETIVESKIKVISKHLVPMLKFTKLNSLLYWLLVVFLLVPIETWAKRSCGAVDLLQQQLKDNPSLQKRLDNIEEHTKRFQNKKSTKLEPHL